MSKERHGVAVIGASGRMGRLVSEAIKDAADMELVARLSRADTVTALVDTGAQTIVDFTNPDSVMATLEWCIAHGVHAVVGTSGFDTARISQVEGWLQAAGPEVGVLIAPNFSIGALLMMDFAARAAAFYESVEVIDLHHADKLDAPSGTAAHTARSIAAARRDAGLAEIPDASTRTLPGARGARMDGIPVHSLRMRGLLGHQEVIFGSAGELLTLRHDSLDRESFVPGVLVAVRAIRSRPGLTLGLERVMSLP